MAKHKRCRRNTVRARSMWIKKGLKRSKCLSEAINNIINEEETSSLVDIKENGAESVDFVSDTTGITDNIGEDGDNPLPSDLSTINRYHCLICHNLTDDPGVSVKENKLFDKLGNEDDFVVRFLLEKILQVPSSKMLEYMNMYGNPKEWVTTCKSCEAAVSQGFYYQNVIQHMEMKQKALSARLIDKIRASWQGEAESKRKWIKNSATKVRVQPVSLNVRGYLVTGTWNKLLPKPRKRKSDVLNQPGSSKPRKQQPTMSIDDNEDASPEACIPEIPIPDNPEPVEESRGTEQRLITVKKKKRKTKKVTEQEVRGSKELYQCQLCPDSGQMRLNSFVQHIHYHRLRPYKCRDCGTFYTQSQEELTVQPAKDATLIIKRDPDLPAPPEDHKCSVDTLDRVVFRTGPIWKCSSCSESFESPTLRDNHQSSHENNQPENSSKFTCSLCPEPLSLLNYNEWRIHRADMHTDTSSMACIYCDETFKIEMLQEADKHFLMDKKLMHQHIRQCHQLLPKPGTYEYSECECEFCGKNFDKPESMISHIGAVHGVLGKDAFLCYICLRRKPSLTTLKVHQYNHMKNFQSKKHRICELCGVSRRSEVFTEHNYVAHGIRPDNGRLYSCSHDNCDFQSTVKTKVEVHKMKMHGMERKHLCSICGKGFLNSSKRHAHEEIHNTHKPHQCEICGNSFAVKNYLYIHMRLSHKNQPFASTNKKKPKRTKKTVSPKSISGILAIPDLDNNQPTSHGNNHLHPAPSDEGVRFDEGSNEQPPISNLSLIKN